MKSNFERFAMAEKVYTLKEVIEEQVKPVNEEKIITLQLLGDEDFPSMMKKTGKSEAELKEIFSRTLRRALMLSHYPDEGSYTINQYINMVQNLK